MGNVRFVGLDVHKESIAVAIADEGRGEPQVVCEIPHDIARLMKELRRQIWTAFQCSGRL